MAAWFFLSMRPMPVTLLFHCSLHWYFSKRASWWLGLWRAWWFLGASTWWFLWWISAIPWFIVIFSFFDPIVYFEFLSINCFKPVSSSITSCGSRSTYSLCKDTNSLNWPLNWSVSYLIIVTLLDEYTKSYISLHFLVIPPCNFFLF